MIILLPPPIPPILSIKTFGTWKFLKHRRGPLLHFWALWDKTTSTENCDCPASLILETFRYRKHFETQECSSTHCFGTGRKKNSTWNRDTQLFCINSFHNRMFLKHRRVALRNDSVLWDKTFSTEIVIPHFNPWKISIPECFWNTEGFHYGKFRYCREKQFRRKIVIYPSP